MQPIDSNDLKWTLI